jgi:hypothetical protein
MKRAAVLFEVIVESNLFSAENFPVPIMVWHNDQRTQYARN